MNYSFKVNNDVLIISLQGRFDTEASAKLETELAEISKENPHGSLVIDASELSYIASSGLRIMLKMVKTEKNFRLENVCPDVYNVFEVTGFSKIIHITKALRKIELEKCEKIGAGGNGAVYRISGMKSSRLISTLKPTKILIKNWQRPRRLSFWASLRLYHST